MKNIEIKKEGITYKVEFRSGHQLRLYGSGRGYAKHWPRVTQCIVWANDVQMGIGEVVKHSKDVDDIFLAKKLSAKKAFKTARVIKRWKEIRNEFWKIILENND